MSLFRRSVYVLKETPFLTFKSVNYLDAEGHLRNWYGVSRPDNHAAVTIVPVTTDGKFLLVSQYRPLLDAVTIEFPAGLMDIPGESVIKTAARELMEETGYGAESYQHILGGDKGFVISAGLSDERHHLVVAKGVTKFTQPLENEGTSPILVDIDTAFDELMQMSKLGHEVSFGVFTQICLAKNYI